MGMGYGAAYADVIEPADIEQFCPKEWQAFIQAIEATEDDDGEGKTVDSFAMEAMYENLETADGDDAKAYVALCVAFEEKTGLSIGIGHHNSDDEGSRYDDVDGAYWWVEGMYMLTPEGEKVKHIVRRHHWVTFG
jgi:hypothetical protein